MGVGACDLANTGCGKTVSDNESNAHWYSKLLEWIHRFVHAAWHECHTEVETLLITRPSLPSLDHPYSVKMETGR